MGMGMGMDQDRRDIPTPRLAADGRHAAGGFTIGGGKGRGWFLAAWLSYLTGPEHEEKGKRKRSGGGWERRGPLGGCGRDGGDGGEK